MSKRKKRRSHRCSKGSRQNGGGCRNESGNGQANDECPEVASSSVSNGPSDRRAAEQGRPIVGFIHIAIINRWQEILGELLEHLRDSGLYAKTSRLFVSFVGGTPGSIEIKNEKVEVVYQGEEIARCEFPTLTLDRQTRR